MPRREPNGMEGRVAFEPPDFERLDAEGLSAVDMHLHTDHSDASVTIKRLLRKAKQQGFGIAITDHNEVSGSLSAFKERDGTIVVPGIEVSAADGPHILVYFHSASDLEEFHVKHVAPRQRNSPWLAIRSDTAEIVEALEGYSCLKVAAHPYGYLMFNEGLQKCIDLEYLPEGIADEFDGFEVICGGMAHAQNIRAVELVWRRGSCYTGGTDGHVLQDIGSVVTCAHASDHEGFLEAVRRRENRVVGKEKHPVQKLATGTVLMSKHSRYFFPSMRVHFEQNAPRLRHYLERQSRRLR